MTTRTTTREESAIISRATRLRARVWANHYALGETFARNLSALWLEHGMAGIGLACRELQRCLSDVTGGYDCFAEARAIACLCPL